VASRAKRKRKLIVSRAESIRTLALVIVVAGVPILGTVFVTTSTSEPDLSELTPISRRIGNYFVLDWSGLLQDYPHLPNAGVVIPTGAETQALGYMIDSGRPVGKGELIQDFVLMPEAGNLMHPAHRVPDQMIWVHLVSDERIQFNARTLVWVWGNLEMSSGLGSNSQALYVLDRARAKPAEKADIHKYFK